MNDLAGALAQRGEPGAHRASNPTARPDVGHAPAGTPRSILVARLERWPDGDESRARHLGSIVIDESDFTARHVDPEGEVRHQGRVGMYDGRRPTPWEAVWRFLAGLNFAGVRSGWRYELGEQAGWWPPRPGRARRIRNVHIEIEERR